MMSADPTSVPVPRGLLRFGGDGVAQRRLYCLPFAGGGPSAYRLWPRSLPADHEVVAVQLPGRDPSKRERPADSIEEIVGAVSTAVSELQTADPMPFALFGHSMGALVAYEVALVLEAADAGPDTLFVSGRRPPDEVHRGEHSHLLPDDEFLVHMHATYRGIPDAVRAEPELLALFLPSLRADIKALETYAARSGPKVRAPVRVYGGSDDPNPRPSQLGGWQRVAEQDISIRVFPGDHFYLTEGRDALAADIAEHC